MFLKSTPQLSKKGTEELLQELKKPVCSEELAIQANRIKELKKTFSHIKAPKTKAVESKRFASG